MVIGDHSGCMLASRPALNRLLTAPFNNRFFADGYRADVIAGSGIFTYVAPGEVGMLRCMARHAAREYSSAHRRRAQRLRRRLEP